MKGLKLGLIFILIVFIIISCKQEIRDFFILPLSLVKILKTTQKTNEKTEEIINNLKILNEKQKDISFLSENVKHISFIMAEQVEMEKQLFSLAREQLNWVTKSGHYNTKIYENVLLMRRSYYRQEKMNKEILSSSTLVLQKLSEANKLNSTLSEKLDIAITLNK